MTIASEIQRLQNAKNSIKTSIEWKWITVLSSVTLDWYSTLIDNIQTWVPQSEYDELEQRYEDLLADSWSLLSWITLWSINLWSRKSQYPLWWWTTWLFTIWNYFFTYWPIWTRYIWSSNYQFDWYCWIVYKQKTASTRSTITSPDVYQSNRTSNWASIEISARYIWNNIVNFTVSTVWNFGWWTTTKHFDWTIWWSFTETSEKTWESLNWYKLYTVNCSMSWSSWSDCVWTFKIV